MVSTHTVRRAALVTGASYGIGAATALALARAGYDVAIAATRLENLAKTHALLKETGVRVATVGVDVRSAESVERACVAAFGELEHIDTLVNNAGLTTRKAATEMTQDEWGDIMRTNIDGTFYVTQQFARHVIAGKRSGCIVNIGSTHAIIGATGRLAYGVSKAAIHQMTRMLAIEWAPNGIRVNAVAPGRVESGSPQRAESAGDEKLMQAMRSRIPLGRFCTVEDVAEAVRYLASDEAAYVTGHTLVLDGGLTVV